ncbi:class I SAM-dependent DNA methyltransferase [Coleofasciculus sp. G2-EDA-02]|uniref:class I SAM-dependent DNA methyltransferase n=1 Tax=Coleofasciculus sp. G2-EDA-02 TaxID=3069529 RepID=UPI0032FFCEB5
MNAVEIEEAVSQLAEAPFDPEEFPFAFLEAFGNKSTTIKRLKSKRNSTNQSDLGGVLQRNNIHIKVCPEGEVTATLTALRESPATAKQKAKFILATDGKSLEAENLVNGETVVCDYPEFHNHFGFFLPLAGITTVKQIRENAFDIKATGRLNKLYVELLNENPDWDTAERREALNHFMARLIFCFFAEDTNIFYRNNLFTDTIAQMSAGDSSNTHEVLEELFRAMATPLKQREKAGIRNWADDFPYANGGLFSGGVEVPRFSRIARSYLLHVGNLDWTKINPDIFGSMIQAVADEDERGALGMHYTSVPNILKVLNPLFLDDLRKQLEEAGDNARKLLNLRKRLARIRVFDPACGSGNFLVIAYKEMRAIEAEINQRRGEANRASEIPLTNFRGIEIRHFSCEIARLALIIAEYQCDVLYRGQRLALAEFLPLKAENWITCGNALRLDWLSLCPPTDKGVRVQREDLDLWGETEEEAEIDFENEGGETYICGNPPYVGDKKQSKSQKSDIKFIFSKLTKSWKSLDYICGFFFKAFQYLSSDKTAVAFVSTNSIVQGQHVPRFWDMIIDQIDIFFAVHSFAWSNLAANKAGVTCVIIGFCSIGKQKAKKIYEGSNVRQVSNISPYLIAGKSIVIKPSNKSISDLPKMTLGNVPKDKGGLLLSPDDVNLLDLTPSQKQKWIKKAIGSSEYIQGKTRFCLWLFDEDIDEANENIQIQERIQKVKNFRNSSIDPGMVLMTQRPHQFREMNIPNKIAVIIPRVSSERRCFLPTGIIGNDSIITDRNYAIYDQPLWSLSLISSRLHWVWIGTVCVRMRTDFSYSNTLGWNTFPVPTLTEKNKTDLTRCAEDILLAREQYFPATIADMYDPERMDKEFPLVREAHDRNDEVLERIYIGRRFKNDTERLEKLFELYTKMTAPKSS